MIKHNEYEREISLTFEVVCNKCDEVPSSNCITLNSYPSMKQYKFSR